VEETALAVEALSSALGGTKPKQTLPNQTLPNQTLPNQTPPHAQDGASLRKACEDGIAWLVDAAERKHLAQCSPIGFYFAKLWYYEKLYPLIFAVAALSNAASHAARPTARQSGERNERFEPPALKSHPLSLSR
jgi:squalene-hopene/tetraprenyl-beta-curcumene cyclase